MGQDWCGKWMPRKKTTCARTPGHGGPCKTAETMKRNRLYRRDHPHRESPESRKRSNRKYRISSYGLTQELFDLLLEVQQNSCGMCHSRSRRGSSSTWIMITRAAGPRTDRAESVSEDSCAMPATSRWATSNAGMRWPALTWTALRSGSSTPPSLQPGKALRRDCRSLRTDGLRALRGARLTSMLAPSRSTAPRGSRETPRHGRAGASSGCRS